MREIKFRAWDTERKIMDYNPYGDEFYCEGTPINDIFTEEAQESMHHIIEQFTGLHDKNGKEIYEGDILTWGLQHKKIIRYEIKTGLIVYGHGDFGEELLAGFHYDGYYGPIEKSIIIGNIHENPELLND